MWIDPFCVTIREYRDWIIEKEQRFISIIEVKSKSKAASDEDCVVV